MIDIDFEELKEFVSFHIHFFSIYKFAKYFFWLHQVILKLNFEMVDEFMSSLPQ